MSITDRTECSIVLNRELFKNNIRFKRIIDSNLSVDACAKEIGISKPTLSRIENGNMPDLITFFKILKWLGCDAKIYINY